MKKYSLISKGVVIGIVLVFIGTSVLPSTAQEKNQSSTPSSRGSWLYVGGSGPFNFTDIQSAVDASIDGDTIFVYQGTYGGFHANGDACVYIDKSITLLGEDKYTTIIDANLSSSPPIFGIIAHAGAIKISGFTIRNAVLSNIGAGITINAWPQIVSNVMIHDNIFEQNINGIIDFDGLSCRIYNNTFTHNGAGIWIDIGKNCIVANNVITNNSVGVYVTSRDSQTIENNLIKDNIKGIYIHASTSFPSIIQYNNLINNTVQAFFIKNDLLLAYILQPGALFVKHQWRHNYWSNWKTKIPKPIFGLFILEIFPLLAVYMEFPFPRVQYDWTPAQEPYILPG
jgi:parallel beta-helix repeat protein